MTAPTTKVCSLCKRDLPTTDFYRHPHASLGVGSRCRACASAYARVAAKEYYRLHRDEILAKCRARTAKKRAEKLKRAEKAQKRKAGAT